MGVPFFASQLSGKEGEPPVEPAAPRFAICSATAVLVLVLAAPVLAAPGPDASPGGGSGPAPDPSGGKPRAAVTVHAVAPVRRPVVTPSAAARPPAAKPHPRHARRHVEPAPAPAPHATPSSFFTSLRTSLPVRVTADTARGIDSRSLKLAAGALLLVVAVGGSFLTLVSQTPRIR